MKIIETIHDMQLLSASWQQDGLRIGFVPTMGNLHAGHLNLVQKAQAECDKVVVSIFVNPLQFNDSHDFSQYPRTLDDDTARLSELNIDAVFVPSEDEFYPEGKDNIPQVAVPRLANILEGASRAGHFVGMATVVKKLFDIIKPDVAIFGEKDFQQLLIVQQMVADLNIPVQIMGMPTTREADGLAMSSRNHRLSAEQRQIAPVLYQRLQAMREALLVGNEDSEELKRLAFEALQTAGFEPDYIEVRDAHSLAEIDSNTRQRVILAAALLGDIRLIDNLKV